MITRLALIAVGLTVGLALVELGLRLVPATRLPESLAGFHEIRPDREWLYGLRPGAAMTLASGVRYEVNADGFRDRFHAPIKPPDVFRVVVLGDSVTFGVSVREEQTFPRVLETLLAGIAPGRFEVLNLGVSGYNPYTEAALLADRGMDYAPDLVLVQFCSNDLNNPAFFFDEATSRELEPLLPDAAFPDPADRRRLPTVPLLRACPSTLRLCRLIQGIFIDARPRGQLSDLRVSTALLDGGAAARLHWLGVQYARMAETAAAHGARFVAVLFPDRRQLEGLASGELNDAVTAAGRHAGWAAIDLLPAFRSARRLPRQLLFDLWHLTAEGHALAADALLHALACGGWVPRPGTMTCEAAPASSAAP